MSESDTYADEVKGKFVSYKGKLLKVVGVHNGHLSCEDRIGSVLYKIFIWGNEDYKIYDW